MRNPKPTNRDITVHRLTKLGVMLPDILRLMSYSRAIQRLSVALCNGEWPYPKPGTYAGVVREACEDCGSTTAAIMLKLTLTNGNDGPAESLCPLCRAAQSVRKLAADIIVNNARLSWNLEVCRDGGPGLSFDDGHGYSDRIAG